MKIHLRPTSTPADKDFCRRVHHAAYREVVIRQFGAWNRSKQDQCFEEGWNQCPHQIIELDGHPIGCFAVKVCAGDLEIVEIQLLPEFQGQGIGSELLRRQIKESRRLRLALTLRVLKQSRALKLYERHGFIVIGESETHFLMEHRSCK